MLSELEPFKMNIIESLFSRHLVVGGDDDNQNLWMSDSRGETWRKSVPLPYGPGFTSYGASLFQREHKVIRQQYMYRVTICLRTRLC